MPLHQLLELALRSLPHGPEFRFLDRLLSLVPGQHGVGEYRLRGDEYFLRGHLPGEPLLPGVLLIEAAAQLAGVVAQEDPTAPAWPGLKLTALRAVKILGTVRPGDTLRLEAKITAWLGPLVQARTSAFLADVLLMSAEITLSGASGSTPVEREGTLGKPFPVVQPEADLSIRVPAPLLRNQIIGLPREAVEAFHSQKTAPFDLR